MSEHGNPDELWSRLFSTGIDAWYNGNYEAGRQACECLLAMPNVPEKVVAQAFRNLSYYAQPLANLCPGVTFTLAPRLEQPGWTWLNPGVLASDSGVQLVVRVSNHTIEREGWAFFDRYGAGHTHHYFLQLDHDLHMRGLVELADNTSKDGMSAWPFTGFEDMRLIRFGDATYGLGAARNRNPDGICQPALVRIDNDADALVDLRLLSDPSEGHQKNWMPFVHDGELLLVQYCHPLVVRRMDLYSGTVATVAEHATPGIARFFRGGSQGVPTGDGTLFVVHEVVHIEDEGCLYLHRFILIDQAFRLTRLSPQFHFAQRGIEYCAGMAQLGDDLLVSFGIGDEEACLARLPLQEVMAMLHPMDEIVSTDPVRFHAEAGNIGPAPGGEGHARRRCAPRPDIVSVTLAGHGRAATVAGAIESVIDHVDACLVIDTDGAADVIAAARDAAGSKYHPRAFPWCNDFAAARNGALRIAAECGAKWAIMLDTDERLLLNDVDLREVLDTTDNDVLSVGFVDGVYAKPRIFRLPVHGEYVGQTHEYFQMHDGRHSHLPGVLCAEHPKNAEGMHEKIERDLDILRAQVASHPLDPRWSYYLGETLQNALDFPAAIEAFARCASLGGWREEAAWARYHEAECWLALGAPREAIRACAMGLARHAGIAELAWLAAYASWVAEEHEQAVHWAHLARMHGYASDAGTSIQRNGFRNPIAQYEGPFDVLRHAYRALGNDAAADEAERQYARAQTCRLGAISGGQQ